MRGISKTQVAGLFLTGAAVGAAAALLFAPKSGAQTRKDIRKFSKETVDQLGDLQSDIREQISERYDQVIDVFENVKEYVEDGKNKIQKLVKVG